MSVTPDSLTLIVEALRARGTQHQRAGALLSQKLTEQRANGVDVRSKALRVVEELAAGTLLDDVATSLENGTLVITDPRPDPAPAPGDHVDADLFTAADLGDVEVDTVDGTVEVINGAVVEVLDLDDDGALSSADLGALEAAFESVDTP